MQDEVKVTQADREAAYGAYFECYDTAPNDLWLQAMLEGRHDEDSLIQVLARHRQSAERGEAWRPIETAPYDTPVEVKVGSMTFLARLLADASMSSLDETCDQWQAEIDGEHPPCWSGGACWASNENEDMSLQPTAWRTPTPPEAA